MLTSRPSASPDPARDAGQRRPAPSSATSASATPASAASIPPTATSTAPADRPHVQAAPPDFLAVENLHAGYGPMTILHGVDLAVKPGEIVCLLGANGAGKSTLLRAVSGLLPITRGEARLRGVRLNSLSAEKIVRLGMSHVPEGREIFGNLTVDQNLRLGAYTGRLDAAGQARARQRIYRYFPVLERKLLSPASSLSGGEQQMVAMGRALMNAPDILLLDEPSLGLAPMMIQTIFDVIGQLRELGVPILLVEQNATAALRLADRGYVLEHGRVVASASAAELLRDDVIRRNYLGL